MVNLLYFQQLALVAFPYFPYSSLFCALFFYINFKFETVRPPASFAPTHTLPSHNPVSWPLQWTLSRFMQKPLKPWSAKDSGSFFIKFYLSSIVVLIASSVFFLGNRTFPKVRPVPPPAFAHAHAEAPPGAGVLQVQHRLRGALWGHDGACERRPLPLPPRRPH